MKMLNLIIALQLVLLQTPMAVIGSSYTYAQVPTESCAEGMHFDMKLNRCVLKREVQDTKVKANACADTTGDARRECFEQNVRDEMTDMAETTDVKDGSGMRYAVPVIVTLVAAYYLLKLKFSDKYGSIRKCFTGSMWLMLGGAVAGLVTEISAQSAYKKKLKELEEDYKANMEANQSEDAQERARSSNAQTLALEFMIEQEKARYDAAKRRKTGYMISGMAYTGAAALAIYEQVQTGTMQMGACTEHAVEDSGTEVTPSEAPTDAYYTPKKQNSIKMDEILFNPEMNELFGEYAHYDEISFDELNEIFMRKFAELSGALSFNAFASDESTGNGATYSRNFAQFNGNSFGAIDGASVLNGGASAPSPINHITTNSSLQQVETTYGNVIDKAISTPWIRAALAGVLAGYSFIMMKKAKENMKIAEDRIAMLEEILFGFEETGGAGNASYCQEGDRRNPGKPNCYCYNDDGSVNNVRKNRDVCKFYMANKSFAAGDYKALRGAGYNPMKSCLKGDGKIDAGCSICDRSPEQCNIIPAMTVNGMTMGSTKVFGKAMKSLNDFNNGGLNASNIDEANINNQTAAFRKLKDKLSKDPRFKAGADKAKNFESRLRAATLKAAGQNRNAIQAIVGSVDTNLNSGVNGQLEASLSKEVKDKLDKAKEAEFTSGGSDGSTKAAVTSSGDDFDFGFGDTGTGEGGVEIEDDVSAVMDKKFNFKHDDIHKNENGDIFKILSIRYQRSALIRLFDDQGDFKADKASNSDINSGNNSN